MARITRISVIHQKLDKSYQKHLKKLDAVHKFNNTLDYHLNLKEEPEEAPRRVKNKYRHILTDEEIKQDLEAIKINEYEPKTGDKVRVAIGDEEYIGEITKVDSKEFVMKLKGGEKMKVQFSSVKNGNSKVNKL